MSTHSIPTVKIEVRDERGNQVSIELQGNAAYSSENSNSLLPLAQKAAIETYKEVEAKARAGRPAPPPGS